MSKYLTEETKKSLSKRIGIPYDTLIRMDEEDIERLIEKKTGKKITWPIGVKVDGLPICTMEDVERRMQSLEDDCER